MECDHDAGAGGPCKGFARGVARPQWRFERLRGYIPAAEPHHRPTPGVPAMDALTQYLDQNRERFLDDLKAVLRIPSVSAQPEHAADVRRCAEHVAAHLRAIGITHAEVVNTKGHPVVYGEWLGAPGAPTMLLYGHYDVQPPDPLDEWKSPPFEPEVRGDSIYARGACDDKGQVYIQIKAVEGLLKTTGKLPVNVKFLLEGEEETGGEHIEEYVKTKPPRLQATRIRRCLLQSKGPRPEPTPRLSRFPRRWTASMGSRNSNWACP